MKANYKDLAIQNPTFLIYKEKKWCKPYFTVSTVLTQELISVSNQV